MQSGPTAASGGYAELALTSLVVLVLVCVVVLVVARYAGRWLAGRGQGSALIRVRARVPLEARRSLCVVEVGGRTLLLGSSEGGIAVLAELAPGEVPVEAAGASGFAALWAQAMGRRAASAAASRPTAATADGDSGARDEVAAS